MAEIAFGASPQPSYFVRPGTSGIRSRSSSSVCLWSLRGGAPRLQLEPQSPSLAFSLRSSPTSPLFYFRDRLYTGVVSSDFKATTPTTVDTDQPELDSGGGAGNGIGDKSGGGGGGGGDGGAGNNDGDSDKGEEGSGADKKKMAILMSQKFTLGYAALVGAGGIMGYLKGGSQKSLLAGGLSAALLYYVYTELPVRPVFASSVGLGISAALLAVMGSRFKRSGKVFPAGVVSLVSLVMTGGYLHGIMRSVH